MKPQLSALLVLVLFPLAAYGQSGSINNTLGTGGTFTVKDGTTTFLSLGQSDGYLDVAQSLRLPLTTSSGLGVIFKGADRFIHNYTASGTDGCNTFVGVNAGNFTMSGGGIQASYNTSVGENSLMSITSGYRNSAFGYYALFSNTTGSHNDAFGFYALSSNISGGSNSAFGSDALHSNTTGSSNAAFGSTTLYSNTTGSSNSAFGRNALYSNTTGTYDAAFGYQALFTNTTGYSNSAFGYYALRSNTGNRNSALGDSAGYNLTSGSNNTLIGYKAMPSSATISNEITLGNSSVTSLRCQVTTITALSDARDKRNIKDLPLGLEFLMNVKPRLFSWDQRDWYENGKPDGSKMQPTPSAGFIAQELEEVQRSADAEWLGLVLKSNQDRLEATPGNLLPIMVKAIQDLKHENDQLRDEVRALNKRNERVAELEKLVLALDAKLASK